MEKIIYTGTFDEENMNTKMIAKLIKQHQTNVVPVIKKNLNYYKGEHKILARTKTDKSTPNNHTVCNHAKDIADISTGYFMSSALTFNCTDSKMNINELTDKFDKADVDEVDHDNALDMSRCGCAFEYVYAKENTNELKSKNINPLNTFIVYDDTIEERELFAIYYSVIKTGRRQKYNVDLFTINKHYHMSMDMDGTNSKVENQEDNNFNEIPIILYQNNKDCIGDYEQQISLIDAYNTLTSDRVNDKEQFLNSLLILYGTRLADDVVDESGVSEVAKALKVLKENGFLELPEGSKAEYIAKTFDEQGVEVLRRAIKEDIYTFSHVPNMSDENFAGNASGVAMEYKLLALENLTSTKERYYTKGLKKRIRLFCNYSNLLSISANASVVVPVFSRGLPKNLLELSQMINNLKGFVSKKTLIAQIPFIEDPDGELARVEKENQESIKHQQLMFGFNNSLEEEHDTDESEDKRQNATSSRKAAKSKFGRNNQVDES